MGQTQIIASYPCLGKTTLTKLNRTHLFERDKISVRKPTGLPVMVSAYFF